jgi:hypothetical protein
MKNTKQMKKNEVSLSKETVICRICKKKVSRNAKRCSHCGTLLKLSPLGMILVFLVVFFIIGLLVLILLQ